MEPPLIVADAPARPLLIWDGDCGFCRLWVMRWQHYVAHAVDTAPYQEVETRFPEIPREHFRHAVQLVEPNGEVHQAAHAVFRAFAAGGYPLLLRVYQKLPLFAAISEALYAWVAKHRVATSKITAALWGRDPSVSTFRLSRSLFLRGLGVVALAAFVSAWTQIDGLIGSRGIEPAPLFLSTIGQMADSQGIAADRYRLVPTLFWLHPTDGMLHALLAVGAIASGFLILDALAPIAVVVAWASYLSIVTIGDVFFGYQWDALLLETLIAALFVVRFRAPFLTKREAAQSESVPGLIVPRALFFKLMFLSGLVKLASHDAAWSSGHALAYHFWTQPLPTRFAWMAQSLPESVRHELTFAVLAIELIFPFFLFAPRRLRRLAFAFFALLQVGISLTGSYGFFNLLTLLLALPMLDDAAWRLAIPSRFRSWFDARLAAKWPKEQMAKANLRDRRWLLRRGVPTTVVLALILTPMLNSALPSAWTELTEYAAPLRRFNSYGLFALMTTERPEITIEGSMDGVTWAPYIFRYKPGPLGRTPRWTGLHMPRLDWQMWFAALRGDCRQEHWYVRMMRRLFEASPPVLALFDQVPFAGKPPKYIRSTLSQHRFTTSSERASSGALWAREGETPFCPIVYQEDAE